MLIDGRFRGTERAAVVEAFSRRSRMDLVDRMLSGVGCRAGWLAGAQDGMAKPSRPAFQPRGGAAAALL